jgi:ion channel
MAVITVAGVGYGEIVPTANHPALRIFNMFIGLFGVAITVYVSSVVAAFLVEIEVTNPFWRHSMQNAWMSSRITSSFADWETRPFRTG